MLKNNLQHGKCSQFLKLKGSFSEGWTESSVTTCKTPRSVLFSTSKTTPSVLFGPNTEVQHDRITVPHPQHRIPDTITITENTIDAITPTTITNSKSESAGNIIQYTKKYIFDNDNKFDRILLFMNSFKINKHNCSVLLQKNTCF